MVDFSDTIENLKDIGFYDIFLPFLLIYAITFAILQKSEIFQRGKDDKDSRSVNAIIAFVFGLFAIASIQTVRYIQGLITNIVVFLVFLLVVLILLSFIFGKDYFKHLFEGSDGKIKKPIVWSVASIILGIATIILFEILGIWEWIDDKFDFSADGGDITSFIVLALIVGVLVWITMGSSDSKEKKKDD